MHVFDLFIVVLVNPERDLEMNRFLFNGAGDDVSNEEKGKILLTNEQSPSISWRLSGADSSATSLMSFVGHVRQA